MRKRVLLIVCILAGILLLLAGVRRFRAWTAMGSTVQVDRRLVDANTDFAFRLFKTIASKDRNRNVLISPCGVSMVLTLAQDGARGKTKAEMRKALGLDAMTPADLDAANKALLQNLNDPGTGVQLEVANAVWAGRQWPIVSQYLATAREYYGANAANVDLASAGPQIDSWVRQKTHGKIDHIAEGLDSLSAMVLTNAVYFKGTWTCRFDRKETRDRPFFLYWDTGTSAQVPTMHQKGSFRFYECEEFAAAALPYGSGRMSMYVFVPSYGSDLHKFLGTLNAKNWNQWLSRFERKEVDVDLPRWKLSYDTSLIEPCMNLGMRAPFADADFRDLCERRGVYIDRAKQKAFIEVNENGTEAAAGTFVLFEARCASPRLRADRPFFYAIRDDRTGEILFMGTVVDPTQTGE